MIKAETEKSETEKPKTDIIEESQKPEKEILEWVEINGYDFKILKNHIDNAVNKNLGPFLGKEKINYLPLQDSLQKILDGQFNNAEEERKYSPKNIYEKYVKRVNELYTQAAEDMKEIFKEVRKIYIPPRTPLADEKSDADTD